jgi:hypothetical protein
MGLDIRIPLGLIFLVIGGIMTGYGFFTRHSGIYARSLDVNLNLGCQRQKWHDDPVNPRPWERKSGR